MKKIFSTLLVGLSLLLLASPVKAQLKWGIRGGLNLSKVDFSNAKSNLDAKNFTGFFIGPMAEFTLPIVGLGVDGALLYSQTGISFVDDNDISDKEETIKNHALEIPINLKYTIGLGSLASVYAAAGPQFAFSLSSDEYSWMDYTSKPFKKSQLSLNLGLGVKLINHIQAGVVYNIPLGDTAEYDGVADGNVGDVADAAWGAFTAKNKTWKVSVAYIF